jgi:hydroxymethylglutaryl-CoA reductase (NADPH)
MLHLILSAIAWVCQRSARLPIQTIVLVSVLTCTAYFSILDLSVPTYASTLARRFYFPAGSGASNFTSLPPWTQVHDLSLYPDASRYIGARIVFAGSSSSSTPNLKGVTPGRSRFEKEILLPEDAFNEWRETISQVRSEDNRDVWRLRKSFSLMLWIKWNLSRLAELISKTEPFDLAVVGVAYLGMYYTFVSLFLSMRRLGSNLLLAISVLLSSTFAFMFAYVTSFYIGVPVSMRTMSEGLPFLVATVGFESKISFTRIALRETRKADKSTDQVLHSIICGDGKTIFRDYLLEIVALMAASRSGVNGLWQFCFLSAWVLFYDVILLATFYSAIVSIKVEMIKIERNDIIRTALEEDGVSHEVAESVADSLLRMAPSELGRPLGSPFRTLVQLGVVVGGFVFLSTVQFSDFSLNLSIFSPSNFDQPLSEALMAGLPASSTGTIITVFPTLVFEHSRFSVRIEDEIMTFFEIWTKIIGDPLISKCIVLVLAVSVGLNGYLLNAARTPSIKVLEKVVEVQKEVPMAAAKHSSDSDVSDSDDGLELKAKTTRGVMDIEPVRTRDECVAVMKSGLTKDLENEEIIDLGVSGDLPLYALEKHLRDTTRAVEIRRAIVSRSSLSKNLEKSRLPFLNYDYDRVMGTCCENVIGYMPIPVGIAGPLVIDGKPLYIPMATTEGCLVASTQRGCKAINAGGGVTTVLTQDGMTRGPCVRFASLKRAGAAKIWLDSDEGQRSIKKAFDSTSRFARLQSVKTALAGTLLFIRFRTTTGDAMGMNMISKGVEFSLKHMVENCGFSDMEVVSVSGNYCTDKKPAAINWIEGRGKSVVAEAIVPGNLVRSVLKSDVDALVQLNVSKNLIGSAMAGSVGGFNAHAANLVTAIFLATGQDPAQNVESSNCITLMNNVNGDLQISVSMPCIEVGTIGGGTVLEPQGAMLDLLGVRGPHATNPGANAQQLARIVASGVLAAELSLCSALAAGHLVQSHMTHNRSKAPTPAATPALPSVGPLTGSTDICIKS